MKKWNDFEIKETFYVKAELAGNIALKIDLVWEAEHQNFFWVNGLSADDHECYGVDEGKENVINSMVNNWDYENVEIITKEQFEAINAKENIEGIFKRYE